MIFLEERIAKDGIVKEGNILKVDRFLNHQTPKEGCVAASLFSYKLL